MRLALLVVAAVVALVGGAGAQDILRSTSLTTCQDNSGFTASLLNIFFTPSNNSAYVHMIGVSTIDGYAVFDITITVYGYDFLHKIINPCQIGLPGLCPMTTAKMDTPPFVLRVSPEAQAQIPGIAYTFPDLDAKVRVYINMTSGENAGRAAACLELNVSNGKTVDLVGVQWAAALVIVATLLASAAIGQLGHFNAASHVVVHTLALFAYFQAQAIIGLCGVPLPPIVQAWTQDFQWSLGLIRIGFMQSVLTWYQRATGGTPSSLLDSLSDVSVAVQKRSVGAGLAGSAGCAPLSPRSVHRDSSGSYVVFGIQRAAFRAGIEPTNAFLTVFGFFTALMALAALAVLVAKAGCELAVRFRWISARGERTRALLDGWRTILKGALFRCLLAGYPAIAIFCLYECTQIDSSAEVVDAVVIFALSTAALAYATYNVIRIASRSIGLHRNPAYILFSDPRTLNKWGCFYVPFRASAYYGAVPILVHALLKAAFVAFAQHSGTTQAIGLIIIEGVALGAAIYMRPWMDRSTNSFNITICVVNFINAIILLILADVFHQPPLGTGIVGLIFWVLNAAVTLILLLMIIVTTSIIFFRNNPDARYQYMHDDRTSFVKSQVHIASNELNDLAITARSLTPANEIAGMTSSDGRTNHRERLLMLDEVNAHAHAHAQAQSHTDAETESIMSDFRYPLTSSAYLQRRLRSPASMGALDDARQRMTGSPVSGAPSTRDMAVNGGSGHLYSYGHPHHHLDYRGVESGGGGDRAGGFIPPTSPGSPGSPSISAPMLPVEERHHTGLQSPSSPVYGFGGGHGGGSRSARSTPSVPSPIAPTPSPPTPAHEQEQTQPLPPQQQLRQRQQRQLPSQQQGVSSASSSSSSPSRAAAGNYQQVRSSSPDASAQLSGRNSPWRRGVGYEH